MYITAIRDFINDWTHLPWIALHFSKFLGIVGIALLFPNIHLVDLTHFLLMFHEQQPVDMLMQQFIQLKAPKKRLPLRFPSLFQHFGFNSTLTSKIQNLTDDTFDLAKRRFRHENPPADILTTMTVVDKLKPQYAYGQAPGVFKGIASESDKFDIVFSLPERIQRVLIVSGLKMPKAKMVTEIIVNATLQASRSLELGASSPTAFDDFATIGDFQKGEVDVHMSDAKEPMDSVRCLRIYFEGPRNQSMIIIREIQVFVEDETKT